MNDQNLKYIDNNKIYHDLICNNVGPTVTNTTRIVHEKGNAPYIQFPTLEAIDFIKHGFSTRKGGVSKGIYESMNLTFHMNDDVNAVTENFRRMGEVLHITPEHMVYSKQTHTTNVMKVTKEHCGMGIVKERSYDNIDGLITNEREVCLVTSYADCVPLFFVDPVHHAIGASHSGWRGTVGNIASNTVELMKQEFDTNPADLITFIGPSICVDCYEVSQDVADAFIKAYNKNEHDSILRPGAKQGKYQLNLQMANYYNMIHSGIRPENIGISDLCTCCNHDFLFSHRATQGKRGILCGFIYIK